ncbi:HIT family protein [Ideonella paludis]|uniref:HIT family protein n=1 Tax=Ideonella paludis TaxID=1233411 RepID=A0ABS5DYL6_9BURK|nr:HIT family protein [Ideonella paludis]MBQ0936237.1 HIT family protein [Ideonella paludis]
MAKHPGCELCEGIQSTASVLVHCEADLRVIRVLDAPEFPAFYRVIWNDHVAELSDLTDAERARCMAAVVAVERVLRAALQPTKINLAALGNVVPHLHWHVIARFDWDAQFPQPIWGPRQRTPEPSAAERLACDWPTLDTQVQQAVHTALTAFTTGQAS